MSANAGRPHWLWAWVHVGIMPVLAAAVPMAIRTAFEERVVQWELAGSGSMLRSATIPLQASGRGAACEPAIFLWFKNRPPRAFAD